MRRRPRMVSAVEVDERPWLLDEADPLTTLLYVQRCVITHDQARAHLSRSALAHRVLRGDFSPVHRGIYVVGVRRPTQEQRRWIAVLAAGCGALLGGRTALEEHGLRGFPSPTVHVLVPASRQQRSIPDGVAVHRTTQLTGEDRTARRPPCATAERALVDASGWAQSDREARTVIAIAFQQRLVTLDRVERVLSRLTRVNRRRYTARHCRISAGGAHSLAEVDLLAMLRRAGLPEPTSQHERVDASGRRRYIDLYFDEWGLHVEIDGAHHLDPRQAWADIERQNAVWIKGERILRFPAWLVLEEPAAVIEQIRLALIAAGWRP